MKTSDRMRAGDICNRLYHDSLTAVAPRAAVSITLLVAAARGEAVRLNTSADHREMPYRLEPLTVSPSYLSYAVSAAGRSLG